MNRHLLTITLLLAVPMTAAHGQSHPCRISGRVTTGRDTPLPNANIYLEGTVEGTVSGTDGRYSFTTVKTGTMTLVCMYMGYRTNTASVHARPETEVTVNITLKQEIVRVRGVTATASSFIAADEEGVTLTSLDVVRTPGTAADIFRAIKSFPGLQQVGEGAGLFVRGGDVSETAVYLDGALIRHPYKYESPTGGFFGTFNPFLLKGTYFSSGGYSAAYGHALSGVLAMESLDLPAARRIGVGAGLAAQSAFLSVPLIPGKLGYSLSGNIGNSKMMFRLNNSRREFSRFPESFDVSVNTVYRPTAASQLKLFIFRQDDTIGLLADDPDYTTHFHGDGSNRLYNLRFTSLTAGGLFLTANAALSDYRSGARVGVLDLDTADRLGQFRLTAQKTVSDRLTLQAGADYYREITVISGTVPVNDGDVSPDAPGLDVDTDYQSSRQAGFVQLNIITPLRFTLIPGLRVERESISRETHAAPRFSAVVPLTSCFSLTAAAGAYHQYPDPVYYDPWIGNPSLGSMKSRHAILGAVYERDETLLRAEVYGKQYTGLLLDDAVTNLSNNGHGYAAGIDLFLKTRLGSLSGWISYSYLQARRKWLSLPVMTSPCFDITHNLTAVLTADLPAGFTAGMSCRLASGKPYSPAADRYNTERVPPYRNVDINLGWIHSFTGSDMTICYLAVSNLFGRINIFDYIYSSDYQRRCPVRSAFGRSFYFGVQVNVG